MESWIIYGLIAGLFIGLSNFYSKVVAHKKINKHKIMLYSSFSHIIFSALYFVYNIQYINIGILLFVLISVRIIAAVEKNLFIIEGLKYIETSLFYPIHKTIHIFLTFLVGMIIFGEYLSYLQLFAMILGIIVILLLTSKENRKIQFDYKRGIFFLILSNIMILMSSSINKYIASINLDISIYMLLSGIIGCVYLLITKKDIYKKVTKSEEKKEIKIGFLKGFLTYTGFVSLIFALREGPFVLVQIVHTSSIFIPIILATIIYKEKINLKKIIAFLLFFVVIYLVSL